MKKLIFPFLMLGSWGWFLLPACGGGNGDVQDGEADGVNEGTDPDAGEDVHPDDGTLIPDGQEDDIVEEDAAQPDLGALVFGVWLQSPDDYYNGLTGAQNYKALGVNTFMGLWNWPSETDMYPGYAVASMQAIKDADMKVYAGMGQEAVDWITGHPEFDDIFLGYLLGDEPDMNRWTSEAACPEAWNAAGDALIALDSTRGRYANFGKPFAENEWYGSEPCNTGSKESDFALYVEPTTIISSDFYGITDPWESPENHGIWTYGRAVRNTIRYAENRPVLGFVEVSAPWPDATNENWMYQRMQASLVMPIVWNMMINGAHGFIYFCHDFSPEGNLGKWAAFLEPGMPEAMQEAIASVKAYEAVLLTPSVAGTTAVTTPDSVNVITLTKHHEGFTYIFAMGDGNAAYREGLAVDAQISVEGETGTKDVEVVNDSRTITMTAGAFTDHFDPYELHIYKF